MQCQLEVAHYCLVQLASVGNCMTFVYQLEALWLLALLTEMNLTLAGKQACIQRGQRCSLHIAESPG